MCLGHCISFGSLGLAALLGLLACSEGSHANAAASPNEGGSSGASGKPAWATASGAAGRAGGGSVGGTASTSSAGIFGQGGASNAETAGTNGGAPSTGLGGSSGASGAGSAGAASSSASAGSSGIGNIAGSGGSSAAFVQVSAVLGKNCAIKGCHADKQSPHFVAGSMLYATLTGPNTVLAACDYTKLVEAGDPAQSALVRLMNRKCDTFIMPPSCNKTPCIPAADLKTLSDWISAGAPP